MREMQWALALARVYRTCPPMDYIEDDEHKAELDHHYRICPYCSKPTDREKEALAELEDAFDDFMAKAPELSGPIIPIRKGTFCRVRNNVGWRNGYFYNPPMVMVLDDKSYGKEIVQVSLVYHDTRLAGPGDLILESRFTGIEPLFVECWHQFPLSLSSLEQAVSMVTDLAITDTIQQISESIQRYAGADIGENDWARFPEDIYRAYPDWADRPGAFSENDPRSYFREIEVETATVFSASAAAWEKIYLGAASRGKEELEEPGIAWGVAVSNDPQGNTLVKVIASVNKGTGKINVSGILQREAFEAKGQKHYVTSFADSLSKSLKSTLNNTKNNTNWFAPFNIPGKDIEIRIIRKNPNCYFSEIDSLQLACLVAVASSLSAKGVARKTAFSGIVDQNGGLETIGDMEKKALFLGNRGFTKIYVPLQNEQIDTPNGCRPVAHSRLSNVFDALGFSRPGVSRLGKAVEYAAYISLISGSLWFIYQLSSWLF